MVLRPPLTAPSSTKYGNSSLGSPTTPKRSPKRSRKSRTSWRPSWASWTTAASNRSPKTRPQQTKTQHPQPSLNRPAKNAATRSTPTFPPPVNGRQTLAESCHNTAARMTSCRAHRKLYAQDILVDLMALQIKFSVIKVITAITTNAIQWMKTSRTNSRTSTYTP